MLLLYIHMGSSFSSVSSFVRSLISFVCCFVSASNCKWSFSIWPIPTGHLFWRSFWQYVCVGSHSSHPNNHVIHWYIIDINPLWQSTVLIYDHAKKREQKILTKIGVKMQTIEKMVRQLTKRTVLFLFIFYFCVCVFSYSYNTLAIFHDIPIYATVSCCLVNLYLH